MNKKQLKKVKKQRKKFLRAIPDTLLSYYQDAYVLRLQEPSHEISPYITVNFRFELRNNSFSSLIEPAQIQGQEGNQSNHFFIICEKLFLDKLEVLESCDSFYEELYISKSELTNIYQKTYRLLKQNHFQVLAVWDDYNSLWQIHARM